MKPEEKLKQLFKAVREEKVTTDISEVSSWIKAKSTTANLKTVKKTAITQKIIIASAIVTSAIIGYVLLFSGKQSSISNKVNSSITEESRNVAAIDSSKNITQESIQNKISWIKEQDTSNSSIPNVLKDTIQFEEVKNSTELQKISLDNLPDIEKLLKKEKSSGFWTAINDSLEVDTLFNGVKKLVFKGDKCDIKLRGTERSDISMKYHYQLKTKGVFKRKKESNCELSYELKDSVLTIHLQRKEQKFNGISVLSESSKMEFIVPENVDVRMDSDLGDIDVDGLNNISSVFHSSLGDITTTNSTGVIDIETALGDILIKNVSGKLKLVTSMGDISGENISISDDCLLNSSMGDMDVQLNNPISECKLDLSTSMGKVKVKRADLTTKSRNELKTDSGKFKVNMNTSMGNIIVR
jgi:hypothetical protein